MVHLKKIDEENIEECLELKRESSHFVGNSYDILAHCYAYRDVATAYGIYNDDIMVGMIVLLDRPKLANYSFTDLYIADNYQGCGYATEAVKRVVDMYKDERKYDGIVILVHITNEIALKIYEKVGFIKIGTAEFDDNFCKMKYKI